jgi:hypothetical protein
VMSPRSVEVEMSGAVEVMMFLLKN